MRVCVQEILGRAAPVEYRAAPPRRVTAATPGVLANGSPARYQIRNAPRSLKSRRRRS